MDLGGLHMQIRGSRRHVSSRSRGAVRASFILAPHTSTTCGRLERPAVTERSRPLGLPSQVQHSDGVLLLKQRMLCNHLLFHFQYSSGILKRHLRLVWVLHYYTQCVSTLGLLAFQTDSRNPSQVRGTGHASSGAHGALSLSW